MTEELLLSIKQEVEKYIPFSHRRIDKSICNILMQSIVLFNINILPSISIDEEDNLVFSWFTYKDYALLSFSTYKGDIHIYKLKKDGTEFNAIVKKEFVKNYLD